MAKKKKPLVQRLLEAADRWEPLEVGKLCREAAQTLRPPSHIQAYECEPEDKS